MLRCLATLALLGGCSPSVRTCADHTVLLQVTLSGGTAQADHLAVDLTIDAGTPVSMTIGHTPGQATGNIQVEFPHGYPPRNSGLTVHIDAIISGTVVGSGDALVPLVDNCEAHSVVVSGMPDLAGLDFAPVPDLTEPSEAGADFAGLPDLMPAPIPDMTQPPPDLIGLDLAGCTPVAEDCFNSKDDDCDGLADCLDPDCYAGGAPPAICVPVPDTFTLGVTVGNAGCPGAWPTALSLSADINATCDAAGCSCLKGVGSSNCQFTAYGYGSDSTCTTPVSVIVTGYADGSCNNASAPGGGAYHGIGPISWVGDCGTPGGTAGKQAAFNTTETFCSGGATGAGCGATGICVPAGPNHCVVTAGAGQACPTGYVARASTYYTGFDDSTLTCSCSCPITAPGTCTGTPQGTVFFGSNCTNTSFTAPAQCNNADLSTFPSFTISGVTAGDPTCGSAGADPSGQVTLQGAHTICCTP